MYIRFSCGLSKMMSFQCGGSALIWVLCSGRKCPVLSVRIEINWVFVSGHRNRLDIRAKIEFDVISMMESKLTSLLYAGSRLTWLRCVDQNLLLLCAGVIIDFVFVWGPKYVGFNVWIEIDLFLCANRKKRFLVWGSIDMVFCVGSRNLRVFVCRPKITWF